MKRWVFGFLCLGVALYAVLTYSLVPLGDAVHPDMKATYLSHSTAILTHAFSAAVALVLAPFQLSEKIRQKRPVIHRNLGRVYLGVGVLVGGLSGLQMARFAYGGTPARLGFGILAVLWLYTGARGYLSARSGAIAEHRIWMLRNVALTFAAVTLRIYIPLSMALKIPYGMAYPVIAWLCWMPNLLFVSLRYRGARPLAVSNRPVESSGSGSL